MDNPKQTIYQRDDQNEVDDSWSTFLVQVDSQLTRGWVVSRMEEVFEQMNKYLLSIFWRNEQLLLLMSLHFKMFVKTLFLI